MRINPMQLRPYQQAAVNAVYNHLRDRDDNPCVVIPTAGGKTPCMATICKDAVTLWQGRVLVLAHVKELLQQSADKLTAVCPEVDFGIYSAGLKRRDTNNAVIIAGIQSIYKRACELDRFDLIIIDECFEEGTLVKTPTKDVPIENIQPGMYVCHALGIGRVKAISARIAVETLTLEFSDGTEVRCTPNHPFFTDTGWVKAEALDVGTMAFSFETMRMLRERISSLDENFERWKASGAKRETVDEATVLLNLLLQDPRELHVRRGDPIEGEGNPHCDGPQAGNQGRKRDYVTYPGGTSCSTWTRMVDGMGCACSEPQGSQSCEKPEDRYCKSRVENSPGTGWILPSNAESTNTGFSKDSLFGTKRLVRVTHNQSASGRVVFNLHVEGHPSYFANGVLVHNCHLIPPDSEGMYQQFLAESKMVNPRVRIIGFTATPFRLKDGPICAPENILNTICYEVGIKELIRDGFLCPLISKSGTDQIDFGSLHIRAGEFVADEVEALMDSESLVESVCREIVEQTADRNAVLIFSSGVRHGNHIVETLDEKYGIECGFVTGETPPKIRDILLKQFRRGDLKYLCNVNVLTTGFDAPNIDCVAMVRPTSSPGLFYQAVGRGFRLHPSKQNCLVLDFGGNVLRHGPVDALRLKPGGNQGTGDAPAKKCPHCNALIAMGYANCPECGFEFPPPEKQNHEAQATQAPILSGQVTNTRYEVTDTHYYSHLKRGAADDAPRSMRVDYMVGWRSHKSEWICFEHSGYARQRAVAWWKQRSRDPVPETTDEALARIEGGAIAQTLAIQVRSVSGEEYERIIDYELGPLPEPLEPQHFSNAISDEEIPF
jgi:DNA repair protein RadD